jgi:hypothetical protein
MLTYRGGIRLYAVGGGPGLWENPARLFKSDVFEDAKAIVDAAKQVPDSKLALGPLDRVPGSIVALGIEAECLVVILRLHTGNATQVRSPAELLPQVFFQTEHLVRRHNVRFYILSQNISEWNVLIFRRRRALVRAIARCGRDPNAKAGESGRGGAMERFELCCSR